jgi:NitT/TauT family transport system substrate-binding protein
VPGDPAVFRPHPQSRAGVLESGCGLTSAGPPDGRSTLRLSAALLAAVLALCWLLAACGNTGQASAGPVSLRLGYLPNLTHAPALVGVGKGYFTDALGPQVHFSTQTFNAGPAEVEAIFGGALDAAFIGPSPAINAFTKSKGKAVRVVSGAASGGASLVVRPAAGINSPADLRGKTLATPQLGNTQDVALRAYLLDSGLHTDAQGGGDAKIVPTDNATTLQLFQQGKIDGAWVPEPWATRLHQEGGGTVLVDESTLWPAGQFVTTELIVAADFLDRHPDTVKALVTGELTAINWINQYPADAKAVVNNSLLNLTQKKLKQSVLDEAWTHLTFTADPLAATLKKEAADARRTGVLRDSDVNGILDLTLLNQVLAKQGKPRVGAAGLGRA